MKERLVLPALSRRDLLIASLGTLGATLIGCPSNSSPSQPDYIDYPDSPDYPNEPDQTNRYSTTGVPGLNTPDEILSNPEVNSTIRELEQVTGMDVNPMRTSIDPPRIVGTYKINGTQKVPFETQLNSGTFRWYNQTDENTIQSDYNQMLYGAQGEAVGSSRKGEIIRGKNNDFTVYSILDNTLNFSDYDITCKNRSVFIVDGQKVGNDIVGTYFGVPVENFTPEYCEFMSVAGEFYFEKLKKSEAFAEDFKNLFSEEEKTGVPLSLTGILRDKSCFE
jgi:hypothetical protein